jgi:hypothetical protein
MAPGVPQQPASRPAPAMQRPVVAAAVHPESPLDTILAIAAGVAALAAVGTTVWMLFLLNSAISS